MVEKKFVEIRRKTSDGKVRLLRGELINRWFSVFFVISTFSEHVYSSAKKEYEKVDFTERKAKFFRLFCSCKSIKEPSLATQGFDDGGY